MIVGMESYRKRGDIGQGVHTFICKMSKLWRSNVEHGVIVNNTVLYT